MDSKTDVTASMQDKKIAEKKEDKESNRNYAYNYDIFFCLSSRNDNDVRFFK